MADITHGTWIKDGKAVDTVYQDNRILYGRNLILMTNNPSRYPSMGSYVVTSNTASSISASGEVTITEQDNAIELYYRFVNPSMLSLAGLTAGETYRFTGKVKGVLSNGNYLNTRNQYRNATDNAWRELPNTRIDASAEYTKFSAIIAIPANAAAFYFSLSLAGSGAMHTGDTFTFKDIMLTKDYGQDAPYSKAPEDILN